MPLTLGAFLASMALPHVLEMKPEKITRQIKRQHQRIQKLECALRLCSIECSHLHHAKADQHGLEMPCPVEARIRLLLGSQADGEVK